MIQTYNNLPIINRTKLWLISFTLGILGGDRFYLNDYKGGLFKLITIGGLGILYFIDLLAITSGDKISHKQYYWSCQFDSNFNCQKETKFIIQMFVILIILFIVVIYGYQSLTGFIFTTTQNPKDNPKDIKKNNK